MKTRFTLLALGCSLLPAVPTLSAQDTGPNANTSTNSLPLTHTVKYQTALEKDRALGEAALLPPGIKEKMKLTDAQRAALRPIEEDFAKTCEQYRTANQPRIEAALEANQQARESKNGGRIEAARRQLQQVWAGLQPYRVTAVKTIIPLLTPDQVVILEDEKNQWREHQGTEANDPSAH